jgi:SAM-dependent methyltransferase
VPTGNPIAPGQFEAPPGADQGGQPAGDLPLLLTFLGDLRGRTILDLGCADPWVADRALAAGARGYLGLAPTEELLAAAGRGLRAAGDDATRGEVRLQNLDRWAGHDLGVFDVVGARRALQYVRNIARLLETVHHHVASGGRLVFSVDHPAMTAGRDLGDYFRAGERPELPRWAGLPAHHRSLEGYLRELRYCGFRLEEFAEGPPTPDDGDDATPWPPRWAVFSCVRTP